MHNHPNMLWSLERLWTKTSYSWTGIRSSQLSNHWPRSNCDMSVTEKLLGLPSTTAPTRRNRLCTFTVSTTQKRRIKLVDQERKIIQKYLKHQLAWISEHGANNRDTDSLLEPTSALPRALMDINGVPNKSNTTEYLKKQYRKEVISPSLPRQWVPHAATLEGMLTIQITPLPKMATWLRRCWSWQINCWTVHRHL